MKKIIIFLLIFMFVFSMYYVIAKEDKEEKVPDGMEIIEVGGLKVMVIKGSEVRKEGSLIVVEGTKEYAARKFLEIEKRFAILEEKTKTLTEDVERLKIFLNVTWEK